VIALDSNVVLRYLVNDGSPQCEVAAQFIMRELSEDMPGFISLPVVCELVWVMDKTYKLKRDVVFGALQGLLAARQVRFEREAVVAAVLAAIEAEDTVFDLADAIIHAIGQSEGCSHTVTFDKVFATMNGVEEVA
jgi:predicted nucleic-acid-binding protein